MLRISALAKGRGSWTGHVSALRSRYMSQASPDVRIGSSMPLESAVIGASKAQEAEAPSQNGEVVEVPEPPLSVSLSVPGGNHGQLERNSQMERIRSTIKRLRLPPYAKLDVDDVVWVNKNLALVGTGTRSNINGVRVALEHGIFRTERVVTVRDVFERSPDLPTLNKSFKLLSDDVTCILSGIQKGSRRRICNEYAMRGSDVAGGLGGNFKLVRHDMDFLQFLHEGGFRIVPVESKEKLVATEIDQIPPQQSTNHVFMVAPTAFQSNPDAAEDNYFMSSENIRDPQVLQRKVITEFEDLHSKLTDKVKGAGLSVHLFTHEEHHDTPDAVFPNNWFSTHTDLEVGECTLCLYPMRAPNRRKERRPDFIDRLHSFSRYTNVYDMTRQENAARPKFLEGTGSLVLDRVNRVAYAAISERTDLSLTNVWGRVMDYDIVPFISVDRARRPIYHTNVMMSVGTSVAVVCAESIPDARERANVLDTLRSTGHEVVEISMDQVDRFCGNILEVENYYGKPVLAMSTSAYKAFTPDQRAVLREHEEDLIHADISTLENIGGGGVRCSIGELF